MRVGIVAEGRGDLAVITRILKGALGVERDEVQHLHPEYDTDETDAWAMRASQFSNWRTVIDACRDRLRVREFFEDSLTDDARLLVVHIDTAECGEVGYDVARPAPSDVTTLGRRVEMMLVGLMEDEWGDRTCFAIAVEETEAWLLPLHGDDADTDRFPRPKERLEHLVAKDDKRRLPAGEYWKMFELARPLAKRKALDGCAKANASLGRFVSALDAHAMRLAT
jgi:hypothetical protein